MRAVSECDLCPGITAEVKDVGIFELLLVAICGNTKHDNGITGSDQLPIHDNAVVDEELKVRGVENLRVIDGSVMPTIISGNTNLPIMAMAEKAADLIRNSRTSAR